MRDAQQNLKYNLISFPFYGIKYYISQRYLLHRKDTKRQFVIPSEIF